MDGKPLREPVLRHCDLTCFRGWILLWSTVSQAGIAEQSWLDRAVRRAGEARSGAASAGLASRRWPGAAWTIAPVPSDDPSPFGYARRRWCALLICFQFQLVQGEAAPVGVGGQRSMEADLWDTCVPPLPCTTTCDSIWTCLPLSLLYSILDRREHSALSKEWCQIETVSLDRHRKSLSRPSPSRTYVACDLLRMPRHVQINLILYVSFLLHSIT